MTKKELVDEILKIEKVDSRSNLMLKKNEVLESMLESLQEKETNTPEEKVVVKKEIPKKKEINRDMTVACRNLTSGKLIYVSKKTGLETIWSNYGDEEYMDVGELLTMKSSQPKFLKNPWLLVDDEDVAEYLGLKEIYKNIIPVDEIEDFFKLTASEAKLILPKLPKGMRDLIAETARKGIQNGELNNIQLVRLLEQELQLDLISLIED